MPLTHIILTSPWPILIMLSRLVRKWQVPIFKSLIWLDQVRGGGRLLMKIGNIPRAGIEFISLAFWTYVMAISPPRLCDVMLTCLGGSLPDKSVQTTVKTSFNEIGRRVWLGWDSNTRPHSVPNLWRLLSSAQTTYLFLLPGQGEEEGLVAMLHLLHCRYLKTKGTSVVLVYCLHATLSSSDMYEAFQSSELNIQAFSALILVTVY